MSAHHAHESHDHNQPHTHDHGGVACCGVGAAQPVAMHGKPLPNSTGIQTPIRIMQMDCPTEEALLRKKLGGMAGVADMEFNLMQRVLTVTHEPKAIEPILEAVRSLGFTPEIYNGLADQTEPVPEPAKP